MQITSHLDNILDLIRNNWVTMVIAPTGTGKSVGVPSIVAASGLRCFVSVPTITGAMSLTTYQKTITKDKSIGYAAEGNVHYDNRTNIVYATSGHLRRKLLGYVKNGTIQDLDFTDVLMIDEVHSGTIDVTAIMSLFVAAMKSGVKVPRLVLASATPSVLEFDVNVKIVEYVVTVTNFPVEIIYHDRDFLLDDRQMYEAVVELVKHIHGINERDQDILIFASGSREVEEIAKKIGNLQGTIIIKAYGTMSQEEINKIYQPRVANIRKIIIATNVAETTITIPDLAIVIDTLVEKRAETSQAGGLRLVTHWIAKSSANQRTGRTGRTRAGMSYRMCTQKKFDGLELYRPREIDRIPLHELVIELLDVGLSPSRIIMGVNQAKVEQSLSILSNLGMVAERSSQMIGNLSIAGKVVTDMGRFGAKFPLSVANSSLLYQWVYSNFSPYAGIVSCCLIDCFGPSYFWYPAQKPDQDRSVYILSLEEWRRKYFLKFQGSNDVETFLNMWVDLYEGTGRNLKDKIAIRKWADANSINHRKIKEVLRIVEQSINIAKSYGFEVIISPIDVKGAMEALRSLIKIVYKDSQLIRVIGKEGTYRHPVTNNQYRLDSRQSASTLANRNIDSIYALVVNESATNTGHINRIVGCAIEGILRIKAAAKESKIPGTIGSKGSMSGNANDNGPKSGLRQYIRPLFAEIHKFKDNEMKELDTLIYKFLRKRFDSADKIKAAQQIVFTRPPPLNQLNADFDIGLLTALKNLGPKPVVQDTARELSRIRDVQDVIGEIAPGIRNYLDVGCSEGQITSAMTEFLKLPRDKSFATDIIEQAVCPNYNFTQSDGVSLPFRTEEFDFATVFMAAHHFTDVNKMLKEVARVIKPGGYVLIREHNSTKRYQPIFWDWAHAAYAIFNGEETPEEFMDRYESPVPYATYKSKDNWIDLFEKVGFNTIKVFDPQGSPDMFASFYALFQLKKGPSALDKIRYNTRDKTIITLGENTELAKYFPEGLESPELAVVSSCFPYINTREQMSEIMDFITSLYPNGYDDLPNITIMDATARCGNNTLLFAQYFKEVIAVEPDPSLIETLTYNIGYADLTDFVTVYQQSIALALTSTKPQLVFIMVPKSSGRNKYYPSIDGSNVAHILTMVRDRSLADAAVVIAPSNFDVTQLEKNAHVSSLSKVDKKEYMILLATFGEVQESQQ